MYACSEMSARPFSRQSLSSSSYRDVRHMAMPACACARTHVHTAYMQNDKDTNDEDAAAKVRKNLARRKHQMERHAADAAKKIKKAL